jgi:hypothetical protein
MSMAIIPNVKSGLMADDGKLFFSEKRTIYLKHFKVLKVKLIWEVILKINLSSFKKILRRKPRSKREV